MYGVCKIITKYEYVGGACRELRFWYTREEGWAVDPVRVGPFASWGEAELFAHREVMVNPGCRAYPYSAGDPFGTSVDESDMDVAVI